AEDGIRDFHVTGVQTCALPIYEDPLHLIPHELRPEVERDFGIKIEGSLCPSCQLMVREHYRDQIEEVLVHRIVFSEEQRIGIGTFQPSRSEEHTSELQSRENLVCRLLLEKKN